ncbi:MAG TPA: trypsin-like peptidase domain-containing protein [Candidatus Krumholzibacteria bacterium]|nr:trypsin-like peptidase domain-containing protein [Candidatus Krumholzibacteria bacterium]HRX51128.1 trypsin-like peptidase domain-containing protein [Candidatus Krumholzibacteria bacterium]
MRRFQTILGIQALALLLAAATAVGVRAEDLVRVERGPAPDSPFVRVARDAGPSVVSIRVDRGVTGGGQDLGPMEELYRRYFPEDDQGGSPFGGHGSGTGFLVTGQGHILTNNHVIDRADAITVRFPGEDRDREASLVGADPASDLALLLVAADELPRPLTFADSDEIRVGDWAVAVGNPFGNLAGSLTIGVVSAKGRRDLAIHGGAPRFQNFLQTDAAINFGNSGGPLLDIAGRVIGVNTAVNRAGQGIGFAIPSNYARRVLESLAQHGRVIRGWLGVRTADHRVDGVPAGARVEAVEPDSPAAAADLRAGDVIIELGGREIADAETLDFLVSIADLGAPQPCRVQREGRRIMVQVVPAEAPADQSRDRNRADAWLGMSLASAVGDDPRVTRLREVFGTETDRGVMVVEVVPDGPAALAGVRVGDVILAIGERPVADAEAFAAIRIELGESPDAVTLLLESGGQQSYLRLGSGNGTGKG